MNRIDKPGFTRRCLLKAVATGSAAATAGSLYAGVTMADRPFQRALFTAAPVRALHDGIPYFDCSGRAEPARPQKGHPQKPLSALSAEAQYLMGAW